MKHWRSTVLAVTIAAAMASIPISTARASDDMGSSMIAQCLNAACTALRFTLTLDGPGWLQDLSWQSHDPGFAFDYTAGDQITTSAGTNWTVNFVSGSGLTLTSGGDFLQAPVSFDLAMIGVQDADQLIGTLEYWGTAREDVGVTGDPYGANYSIGGYVTPEPVSMLLLGTGLAGVAGAARRKRRDKIGT